MTYFNRYCTLFFLFIVFSSEAQMTLGTEHIGLASFYHKKFNGRKTSNGEIFRGDSMTAAHRTLPFGTMIEVMNLRNKKWVVVRVNDRGPYAGDRMVDLSYAAAKKIGIVQAGVGKVKMTIVGDNGFVYLSSNNIIVDDNKEFLSEITKPDSIKTKVPYKAKKRKIGTKKKRKRKK